MTAARVRFLPWAGGACLVGLGALLALAAAAPAQAADPGGRGAFLVLAVILALVFPFVGHGSAGPAALRVWRAAGLAAVSGLVAVGLWAVAASPRADRREADTPRAARNLAAAAEVLADLDPALVEVQAGVADALALPSTGGAPVRILDQAAWDWRRDGRPLAVLPLAGVLWRGGERHAWSDGARPLPAPSASDTALVAPAGDLVLYRRFFRVGADLVEWQVVVGDEAFRARWPQVVAATPGRALLSGRETPLGAGDEGPRIVLAPDPKGDWNGEGRLVARLQVVALGLWVLAATIFVRIAAAGLWWLAPLWLGRALLAAVELHRWLAAAWPAADQPARPADLASLWDPAYFATPVLGGWFASVIDALLTAVLLATTVWQVVRRAGTAPAGRVRGLRAGLLAGLGAAGLLVALDRLAALLAVNANPRLIGQGVSLGSLSFWALHVVLLLVALSLAVVLARTVAGGWPDASRRTAWLGGGLVACAAAAGIAAVAGQGAGNGASGALVLTGALWLVAPGLAQPAGLRRRLVWPVIVLACGAWNHAALRHVYAEGERAWLAGKAEEIVSTDAPWRRFLLGEVLADMRAADDPRRAAQAGGDVWRQEPAWALWRRSALRDLGLPCLVELQDADGRSEALYASGFLRDFGYQPADQAEWEGGDGEFGAEDPEIYFRTERRIYAGGEEEILAGEIARRGGLGWIHVEVPVRSWRIETLQAELGGVTDAEPGRYRPRSEIDRPLLLLHADAGGWLDAGDGGFPDASAEPALADLRRGDAAWAEVPIEGRPWLCRWQPLPADQQRTPGEGFMLGLSLPGPAERLLDLSRLLLLDLLLLLLVAAAVQVVRALERRLGGAGAAAPWRAGFQERFLAGYLLLGFVLLVLVGASVDRETHERIAGEARARARTGLDQAVDQLRALLTDQARAMAASEYIDDLLRGQLGGTRPLGPVSRQQGMVFGGDGELLLDETLGELDAADAAALLEAGRRAPLVVQRDGDDIYVGTVIPLDLSGLASPATGPAQHPAGDETSRGFFFYRQRVDSWLLYSLADLVQGEITLHLDGRPMLASHPGPVFSGAIPPLAEAALLAPMLDHPLAPGVGAASHRPFALTGCQPLPAFTAGVDGGLRRGAVPALLTVTFPDREREYIAQRRATALFLAGLANLILLTALMLALVMSWGIFRPLRVLMTATRSLAGGDFGAPLPEAGHDEVGRLSDAFGRMRGELRSARDSLAARERFLATVLDRVTVGVAVVADDGGVAALNPAGRRILARFQPGLAVEAAAVLLRDRLQAEGEGAGQVRSADGRRTLRGAVAPLDLPGGRTDAMLVFEDVTEFLETQKLAINAELARQVAHEIKNPLTPIQLSMQLLGQAWRDRHPDFDGMVEPTVQRVLAQVELLRKIAAEFSLLGRPGDLETVPVDLARLVREVAAAWTAGGADGGPRVRVPAADPPAVLADADSLRKILGNLLQNSLDAAAPGRPLTMSVAWHVEPGTVTLVWRDGALWIT
ncbi:MAG TPA: HAMP domain-containing protein, partial [Candidatus Krumholzibacteria bacterium]|nr:HAMP domain-containing protein [Candidatus Krumholzibacteria bacterium]